jgi:hypothetical protein
MAQPTKNFDADGAITAFSIVAPSATAGKVALGAAATDKLLGITTIVPAKDGEPVDVVLGDIAPLKLAGPVDPGDFVTSDNAGLGVVAAPVAGTSCRTIGMALEGGVAGDIIDVRVQPGSITTPAEPVG